MTRYDDSNSITNLNVNINQTIPQLDQNSQDRNSANESIAENILLRNAANKVKVKQNLNVRNKILQKK